MSSNKIDLKRDFAAGVYLSEPRTPTPIPPTQCIRVNSILNHTGKGRELNQRERERDNSSRSWVKNTNMTDSISNLSTLINTCRKVPLKVNQYF